MVFFVVIIKFYNKFSDSPAPQQSCFIFFNQRFLVSDNSTAYFSTFSLSYPHKWNGNNFRPHAILSCSYSSSFYTRKLEPLSVIDINGC